MARKVQQPQIQLTKFQQILLLIQTKPIYGIISILLFVALLLIIIQLSKSSPIEDNKDMHKETVIEISQPTVTINQFTSLEEKIQKQNTIIEKLQTQNTVLENNLKSLDKRLQAHTDVMKRLCEYIVIITVDKKIIPRQCLLEYKWQKEEGQ